MINPPCLDCPERKLGCHSSCKKYKAYRKKKDKEKENRRKEAYKYGRNYL